MTAFTGAAKSRKRHHQLVGEPILRALAKQAFKTAGSIETEVVIRHTWRQTVLFSEQGMLRHRHRKETVIVVRVLCNDRLAVAATRVPTPTSVAQTTQRALDSLSHAPLTPGFPGFATVHTVKTDESLRGFDEDTARVGKEDLESLAGEALCTLPSHLRAAGHAGVGGHEMGVATSQGGWAWAADTCAGLEIITRAAHATGMGNTAERRFETVDPIAATRAAAAKADCEIAPSEIPPATYPVLLEPAAMASLLEAFARLCLRPVCSVEETTPFARLLGQKICSSAVTVADDPTAPIAPNFPFDAEGTTRRAVRFLDAGIAATIPYDRVSAARAQQNSSLLGSEPTGHARIQTTQQTPLPETLFMLPGEHTTAALLRMIDRGILVTCFTDLSFGITDPSLTGCTAHGTFLIENGAISAPIKNLRFRISPLDAFRKICGVGRCLGPGTGLVPSVLAPVTVLSEFSFTAPA